MSKEKPGAFADKNCDTGFTVRQLLNIKM